MPLQFAKGETIDIKRKVIPKFALCNFVNCASFATYTLCVNTEYPQYLAIIKSYSDKSKHIFPSLKKKSLINYEIPTKIVSLQSK